ncbi:MAG: cupin domain-containing protein [Ignavibacteria bacterium]|nr:cupin domain-containing protein [Ignavibacteria bacterium]
MRLTKEQFLEKLPLPATPKWPEGVWDIEAFRHGTLSVLLFTPRGTDYQTNHTQDELYFIIGGSGVFESGAETFEFAEGDVLFVPAGRNHRFQRFSDDLVTWAVFYGPQGGEEQQQQNTIQPKEKP